MAQITYRGNLSAKVFPFVSEYFGRSIIVPGQDQNFSRQLTSEQDLDKDKGTPQVYYCHNVMPSADGFQSIGYNTPVSASINSTFSTVYQLRDIDGNEVFISPNTDGTNWILPFGGSAWQQINTIPGTAGKKTSSATINGQSFIFFESIGCYLYDTATNLLVNVVLAGLTIGEVLGITSSAGYMIAWTKNSVAWSSTVAHVVPTDPIDFVPSDITGAGGGYIEAAKGNITYCKAHYLGFIVYTTDNAIASIYSGNAKFPFNFREIVASGGVSDSALISSDSTTGNHYAYTTSGFQFVTVSGTQTLYPEITDFISGRYFEDFNEVTQELESTVLSANMRKALTVIADRYLVISYGINSFTHAIVYDLAQKRFGKLKIPHVTCFEWKILSPEVTDIPRNSIGFLQTNGTIKTVNLSYGSTTSNGVLLLGKYQYVRSRLIQLDEIQLENIRTGNQFQLVGLLSMDGKNTTKYTPTLAYNAGTYRGYKCRATGINHSLLITGNFYLTTIVLKFNIHGRR